MLVEGILNVEHRRLELGKLRPCLVVGAAGLRFISMKALPAFSLRCMVWA